MNIKIKRSILAGIIATGVMTLVMALLAMLGMPKLSPPTMLSSILGVSIGIGWVFHFVIGIVFAFVYTYLCIFKWKIRNVYLKGVVFGIVVFILVQLIRSFVIKISMPTNVVLLGVVVGLIGHITYGIVVAKIVGNAYCSKNGCCSTK